MATSPTPKLAKIFGQGRKKISLKDKIDEREAS